MVRSITLEVRWHNVCPIYSCHFQSVGPQHLKRVLDHNSGQAAGLPLGKSLSGEVIAASAASFSKHALPPIMPGGQSWRLATAGGDNNARIWMVHPNMPSPAAMAAAAGTSDPSMLPTPHPPRVEYLATLSRHTGVVNVVRFCPKGELLATAGDDGNVLFWIPSDKHIESIADDVGNYEKEHWRVRTMTRPTSAEIYDLAWSPSGEQLIVGGTDFALRVINAVDGSILREISEHCHHIQGVAWDPLNEFLATQSSDRSVHVHQILPRSSHNLAYNQGHALDSHSSFAGLHNISRNSHLTYHRRTGSSSAANVASGSGFVWDHSAKPPMQRRGSSHASIASESGLEASADPRGAARSRSGRSSTPFESAIAGTSTHLPPSNQLPGTTMLSPSMISASLPPVSGPPPPPPALGPGRSLPPPPPVGGPLMPTSANSITMGHNAAAIVGVVGRAVTPTPAQSVPPSPFSTASAMNPPQMTPSRRSSFSGSAIEAPSPPMTTASVSSTTHGGGGGPGAGSGVLHHGLVSGGGHALPSAAGTSTANWTPATSVSAATPVGLGTSGVPKPPPSNSSVSSATGGVGGLELRRSESRARSARSSSPMPLPAIRAPPSPKQRLHHVLAGSAGGSSSRDGFAGASGGGPGPYGSASSSAANLSFSGSGIGQILRTRMYGDENYSGFFRRLNFSPDGALLVTPSGIFEGGTSSSSASGAGANGLPLPPASPTAPIAGANVDSSPTSGPSGAAARGSIGGPGKLSHLPAALGGPPAGFITAQQQAMAARSTVYMYARGGFHRNNAPIAHFPGHKTATLVVSFSPILYELRNIRRPGAGTGAGAGAGGGGEDEGVAPHLTVPLEAGKHKVVPLSSLGRATSSTAAAREEDAAPLPVQRAVAPGSAAAAAAASDVRGASSSQTSASSGSVPPLDFLAGPKPPVGAATMPSPGTPAPSAATPAAPTAAAAASAGPPSMIGLPYRMIFAVATQESVWIYDTQQTGPICCFSNMHYASFTDLSWSPDGQTLVMSSTDGYCSVIVFDYGELGTPYSYSSQPSLLLSSSSLPHAAQTHASKKVEVSPRPTNASAYPYAGTAAVPVPSSAGLMPSPSSSASGAATGAAPPATVASNLAASGLAAPATKASASAAAGGATTASAGTGAGAGGLGLALPESASGATVRAGEDLDSDGQPKKKRRIAPTQVAIP